MSNGSEHIPERQWEACDLGVCAAPRGHDGTCAEASGWAYDEREEIAFARELHDRHPAPWTRCPDCHRFSAHPWEQSFGTQNGTTYAWGGVCRRHGPWREGS